MRLDLDFYRQPAIILAPALLGKYVVRQFEDGSAIRLKILETEAYCGETDLACHACKGKTKRTEVMYEDGGTVFIYLVYGMHYMLNVVSGNINQPEAVFIRAIEGFNGPAKLTKKMEIDKSFNGESFITSKKLWIEEGESEDDKKAMSYVTTPRIGIDKVPEPYRSMAWRFLGTDLKK